MLNNDILHSKIHKLEINRQNLCTPVSQTDSIVLTHTRLNACHHVRVSSYTDQGGDAEKNRTGNVGTESGELKNT